MQRMGMVMAITAAIVPVAGCPMGVTSGNGVSTGFEFFDTSGQFTLGESPNSVTFTGGESKTIGQPASYRTGFFAWMVGAGQTGEIAFETPTRELVLFLRAQTGAAGSVLTLLDADENALATITATADAWTRVAADDIEGQDAVTRITVENTGSAGYVLIDDFVCCGDTVEMGDMPGDGTMP